MKSNFETVAITEVFGKVVDANIVPVLSHDGRTLQTRPADVPGPSQTAVVAPQEPAHKGDRRGRRTRGTREAREESNK